MWKWAAGIGWTLAILFCAYSLIVTKVSMELEIEKEEIEVEKEKYQRAIDKMTGGGCGPTVETMREEMEAMMEAHRSLFQKLSSIQIEIETATSQLKSLKEEMPADSPPDDPIVQ